MTVDDGEWTVDGRRMGGGCVRTGLRSEAIRLHRSLSVLSVAVGFVGRCRFCRGDAGLPRPCVRGLPDKRMEKARLE
jgi:hypothetical protein